MRQIGRFLGCLSLSLLAATVVQGAQNPFDGHYVVPETNLVLLPKNLRPAPIESKGGLHLVRMNEKQVKTLAHLVHEEKFTCGGFIAVDEDLKTRSAGALLTEMLNPPKARVEKLTPKYKAEVQDALGYTTKERFESSLRNLSAHPDRYANAQTGVDAAEWLKDQMLKIARDARRAGVTAEAIPTPKFMQPSIVVKMEGDNPNLPGVLIGGHMDTYRNDKPGADDDGSGTTTVMEVFQAIVESKIKLQRDTYFAFYAAEEWGLYGSAEVVRQFKARNIELRGIMQFDMTGFKSPKDTQPIYLIGDYTTGELTSFSQVLLETYLGIKNVGSTKCGYACSDHASWHRAGYPVAFPFEASMSNYNKLLHTGSDVVNALDMDHAMQFVRLGIAFVVEMAEPTGKKAL